MNSELNLGRHPEPELPAIGRSDKLKMDKWKRLIQQQGKRFIVESNMAALESEKNKTDIVPCRIAIADALFFAGVYLLVTIATASAFQYEVLEEFEYDKDYEQHIMCLLATIDSESAFSLEIPGRLETDESYQRYVAETTVNLRERAAKFIHAAFDRLCGKEDQSEDS